MGVEMGYLFLCLGSVAVGAGLPLYILREIRKSALQSESPELSEPIKETMVRGTRPIDNLSPRRREPAQLPQHPKVETFVGQGQIYLSNIDGLNEALGLSGKVIDGTCRDTDS